MSYLALYRRYRPVTFDGIIGQEHIVKTLVNQITDDRLGHAYLFTGTRGTGKTSTAKIFAKAINCLHPVNGSPCGKCEACVALSDPSNIDVVEIDAASNNGVNEIRELRENVQFPPVSCRYKVYIIDEVHMLTGAAFNALLKTLEEPPKHAVFILATTEAHKIPATILSRCMRFDFRLVSTDKIAELISCIFDEQGKKYDKEAVFAIAKAGEGSIRDALSIADTAFSYSEGKLTYSDVMEILGSTDSDIISELLGGIIEGDSGSVLEIIEKLFVLGKSAGVLVKDVTETIRNLIVIKTCGNPNGILRLPEKNYDVLFKLAQKTNEPRLLRSLVIFSEAESNIRYTNHPRIVFETAAIKAARPETDISTDALVARIATLEDKIEKAELDFSKNDRVKTYSEVKTNDIASTENSSEITSGNQKEIKKFDLSKISESELKGKIIEGLEKLGSEMLSGLMLNIEVKIDGKKVSLIPNNENDRAVLIIEDNKEKILSSLENFDYSELSVEEVKNKKQMDKVNDATEKLKKIFGENIVIVK